MLIWLLFTIKQPILKTEDGSVKTTYITHTTRSKIIKTTGISKCPVPFYYYLSGASSDLVGLNNNYMLHPKFHKL